MHVKQMRSGLVGSLYSYHEKQSSSNRKFGQCKSDINSSNANDTPLVSLVTRYSQTIICSALHTEGEMLGGFLFVCSTLLYYTGCLSWHMGSFLTQEYAKLAAYSYCTQVSLKITGHAGYYLMCFNWKTMLSISLTRHIRVMEWYNMETGS